MKIETTGLIGLHISLRIDVEQLAGWAPERIAALFDGIAKVQAAANDSLAESPTSREERDGEIERLRNTNNVRVLGETN